MVDSMVIKTDDFGDVRIYLDPANKICLGCYYVTVTKRGKQLAGVVDEKGRQIIKMQEMSVEVIFNTNKYNDICFGFKLEDTDVLVYYHIRKSDDGYSVVVYTDPYDSEPIEIEQIYKHSDRWLFKKVNNEEVAIYDPSTNRLVTPFFDSLDFEVGENKHSHYACYCKHINIYPYLECGDEQIENEFEVPSCVTGFIDKDGYFTSQIFDTTSAKLFSSYYCGSHSTSREFQGLIDSLVLKYTNEYKEQQYLIYNTLEYLFNNSNLSQQIISKPSKTKIIEFKKEEK